ncbi:MAG TPA: LysR family transcriptional regulator [Pseudomonadales bacterium]|nr:LysR family transcriptional regulator [Pseudomonadales bacterium]
MDRLGQMAVFARVVETGSFSAAARQLGIAKSAASNQVRRLETSLGVRLLNRTTRRLALTEAGTRFLVRCQRIVAEADEAVREASALQAEPLGKLSITCPVDFGTDHLVPRIAAFRERYPGLRIRLSLDDQVVNLVESGFDLAIRMGTLADSSLIARRLAEAPLYLCASPAYLDRHGRPETPAELAAHEIIIFSQRRHPTRLSLSRDGQRVSVSVQGGVESDSARGARAMAMAGMGIGVMSRFGVGWELDAGRLERVLPDWTLPPTTAWAVYPHREQVEAKVRLFVDYLVTSLEGDWPPEAPGLVPATDDDPQSGRAMTRSGATKSRP